MKKSWRCYLCEKNFDDDEMRGPLPYCDRSEEYFICFSCAKDMGLRNIAQKVWLLLECPHCRRAFVPLLDFDLSQYRSKVLLCPFCHEKNTFKFIRKPDGSILEERSPEDFKI